MFREPLAIHRSAIAAMAAHADRCGPDEACGILLGLPLIERAVPAANVAANPSRHFEVDPAALIAAHRAERGGGLPVAGYYHSHPIGEPVPSRADRIGASGDGRVWAIVGRVAGGRWDMRLWRDSPAGFQALSYTVSGV
jgi:desampylase